jgi:acetamidase/formamidase
MKPGESFEIETYDASTGYFRSPEDLAVPARRPGFDRVPPLANPIGGPVWLEGAERGDTLVVTIKARPVPWMRIDKPASIVSVHAYRPLEVAVETATVNLIDWLVTDHGFTPIDAYCLVSTCPDFRIHVYQMCRVGKLSYVAGAELPKRYLL